MHNDIWGERSERELFRDNQNAITEYRNQLSAFTDDVTDDIALVFGTALYHHSLAGRMITVESLAATIRSGIEETWYPDLNFAPEATAEERVTYMVFSTVLKVLNHKANPSYKTLYEKFKWKLPMNNDYRQIEFRKTTSEEITRGSWRDRVPPQIREMLDD